MQEEIDFCRQRFRVVKSQLEDDGAVYNREARLRLEREYRLLGHILYELKDGQVLQAVESWRGRFGKDLSDHLASNRPQQQAYDAWLPLSWEDKASHPEPPRPSLGIVIEDRNG